MFRLNEKVFKYLNIYIAFKYLDRNKNNLKKVLLGAFP